MTTDSADEATQAFAGVLVQLAALQGTCTDRKSTESNDRSDRAEIQCCSRFAMRGQRRQGEGEGFSSCSSLLVSACAFIPNRRLTSAFRLDLRTVVSLVRRSSLRLSLRAPPVLGNDIWLVRGNCFPSVNRLRSRQSGTEEARAKVFVGGGRSQFLACFVDEVKQI